MDGLKPQINYLDGLGCVDEGRAREELHVLCTDTLQSDWEVYTATYFYIVHDCAHCYYCVHFTLLLGCTPPLLCALQGVASSIRVTDERRTREKCGA